MPLALAFTALEIVPLKIAFASLGTPGKQKISVLRAVKWTAGAVPTGLITGTDVTGIEAILRRGFVKLILRLGNLRA